MCILLLPGARWGPPPPPSATTAPKALNNNICIENSTNKSFIFNKPFHFHYAKEARESFLVGGGEGLVADVSPQRLVHGHVVVVVVVRTRAIRVPGNRPCSLPCYDPSLISSKKSKRHLQTPFILFIYPPRMHILELFIAKQPTRYHPVQEKTSCIHIMLLGYSYTRPPCVFRGRCGSSTSLCRPHSA